MVLRFGSENSDEETCNLAPSTHSQNLVDVRVPNRSAESEFRKLVLPTLEEAGHDEDYYTPGWCRLPVLTQMVWLFFRGENGLPKLTEQQWTTLLVVCVISIFSGFDWELLPMALKAIQDSLHLGEEQLGMITSIVKLGAMPAFFVAVFADLHGRRNALLVVFVVFGIMTFCTAFTQTAAQFAVLQFVARMSIEAKGTLVTSLLLEVMDNNNRGWAVGTQQSMSALGGGLAYLAFGLFNGRWRVLYFLAILQFPFFLYMKRKLPESARFNMLKRQLNASSDASIHNTHVEPGGGSCERIASLFREHPKRISSTLLASFLNGFAFSPSDYLKIKYMQEEKQLQPVKIAALVLISGTFAFLAFGLAGRLSDRYGRKRFLEIFSVAAVIGVVGFYSPGNKVWFLFFFMQLLSGFVLLVVSNSYFGEIFSTKVRTTAQSVLKIAFVIGGIVSVALESVLYKYFDSHWVLCVGFAFTALPVPFIIHFNLPESSGRDLDAITEEDDGQLPKSSRSISRLSTNENNRFVELQSI